MPKAKKQDEIKETPEVIEEQSEPQVEESPEPEEEKVQDAFIDLDSIPLVFDKKTVELWLSKASARITNAVVSAMLLPQALPPKQSVTLLLFAIAAVKGGGIVVVPEVFLGNEYLEGLSYLGPVEDFFAFRK